MSPTLVATALAGLLVGMGITGPLRAQEQPPPIPPAEEDDEPPPPPPREASTPPPPPREVAEERGYYQRCFGVPHPGPPPLGVYVDVPLSGNPGGGWHPGGVPLATGGSSDDKAWLVVAVLAVAVLPVVIYALDSEPPPLVAERFACPTFSFEYFGGTETSRTELGNQAQAVSVGRLGFSYQNFATDFQIDGSSGSVSAFATHLIVRADPKKHVEGGFAFGWRRSIFRNLRQEGLELGLPHRYSFWREGLRSFGLELRPMLLFAGRGVEPSLEGAFLIPLVDVLHLRAGGRVFTFNGSVFWGLQAGLNLTL